MPERTEKFGELIRQQRVIQSLTLQELSTKSGVSPSHLGRIERGERFPSGSILRKIASPLGFKEDELFTLAGYLSPQSAGVAERVPAYGHASLDPYVARVLAQEPIDVQRAVIGILNILKGMSKSLTVESH